MKIKALLYCTKAKPYITMAQDKSKTYPSCVISDGIKEWHLNGKIVAECDFEVTVEDTSYSCIDFRVSSRLDGISKLDKSCLTSQQLFDYVKGRNEFYAIHIKNLHIFDEPRELSECHKKYGGINYSPICYMPITNAPQNMMRVWLYENGKWVMYILISIRPEHLVNILNGYKTIEIRKKILNEMKE